MPQYARRSASAIVMCDVMRKETMYVGAKEWKKAVDKSVYLPNGQSIPCVLLVNKVLVYNKMRDIMGATSDYCLTYYYFPYDILTPLLVMC